MAATNRWYEGESVTLKCDSFIHGNPRTYIFTWKKDGVALTYNYINVRTKTIEFIMSETHEGNYTCLCGNSYGETEESSPVELQLVRGTRPVEGKGVSLQGP